jgi:hypothetical protein
MPTRLTVIPVYAGSHPVHRPPRLVIAAWLRRLFCRGVRLVLRLHRLPAHRRLSLILSIQGVQAERCQKDCRDNKSTHDLISYRMSPRIARIRAFLGPWSGDMHREPTALVTVPRGGPLQIDLDQGMPSRWRDVHDWSPELKLRS